MAMQDDQRRRLASTKPGNPVAPPKPQQAPKAGRAPKPASTQRAAAALPGGFGPGIKSRAPGGQSSRGRPGGFGPSGRQPVLSPVSGQPPAGFASGAQRPVPPSAPMQPVRGPQGSAATVAQRAMTARQGRGATPMTQAPMMSTAGVVDGAMGALQQRGATPLTQAPSMPPELPRVSGASAAESALSMRQQRGATPMTQPVMPPTGGMQQGAAYAPQAHYEPLTQVQPMQPGGPPKPPMSNNQGTPLTVRGSEQSRQLGEQMGGAGTQPMQRFNRDIPREVRQGGYQRAEQPKRSPMEQYQRGQQARESIVRGVGEAVDNTAANLKAAVTPPPIAAGFLGLAQPGEVSPPKANRGGAQAAEMQRDGNARDMSYDPQTRTGMGRDAKTGELTPFSIPERGNVGAKGVSAPGEVDGPVGGPDQGGGMGLPDLVPLSQNLSPRERQGMQGGNPAGGVVPDSVRKKSIDEYVNPQLPNMTYDEAADQGVIDWMDYGTAKRSGAVSAQPYNGGFDYDPTTGMYIAKRPDSARAPINSRTVQGPKVGRWMADGQYGDNRVTTENGVQVVRGNTPADTQDAISQKDLFGIQNDRFQSELEMAKFLQELQQGGREQDREQGTAWQSAANDAFGDLADNMQAAANPQAAAAQRALAGRVLGTLRESPVFSAQYPDGATAAAAAWDMAQSAPQAEAFDVGSAQENRTAYQAAVDEWLANLYAQFGMDNPLALN